MNPKPSSSMDHVSPWGFLLRYSMVHRTSVVLMLVVGFGLSLVAQLGIHNYKRHKEDLLGDFLIQKAKVLEARLQAHFMERSGADVRSPQQLLNELKTFGISTLPAAGRIMVFPAQDKIFATGWEGDSQTWIRDMDGLRELWEGGEEFSFITDENGKVMGSNRDFVESADAERAFKKSPVIFGPELKNPEIAFGESLAFANSAVVRIPVRNTNLILYSEISISGYLRLLRKLSGGGLSVFVFVAFTAFALAGVAANRISEGLSSILMRYQLIERGAQSSQMSPSLSEFSLLNERLALIAMKTRSRFLENSQSAGIKENALALLEKLSNSQSQSDFLAHSALCLAKIIEDECRAPSLILYVFTEPPEKQDDPRSELPALKKMYLMLSGIPVAEPVFRDVANEGWNIQESIAFCSKSQTQLLSDVEVRFPVVCGDQRIGFLLCSGKGINTLSKMKLEWLILMSDVLALGYVDLKTPVSGVGAFTA